MKKEMKRYLIIIILLIFCNNVQAQDSTRLYNFSVPARLIEYLAPYISIPTNDENFATFLKWRTSFRFLSPSATTSITTDTITVNTVAYLYSSALQGEDGTGIGAALKLYLQSYRNNNSNLNRQCSDIENVFVNKLLQQRLYGRKLLTGQ